MRVRLIFVIAGVSVITLGIWVGIVIGDRSRARSDQMSLQASTQLSVIRCALELFRADAGRFPTPEEGLQILTKPIARGPYIAAKDIIDPWGRPYIYDFSGGDVPSITTRDPNGGDFVARPFVISSQSPASRAIPSEH